MIEIEYDIFCDGDWVAGATDLTEARHYGLQYCEDGDIEIFEVKKESSLILQIAKKKASKK